MTRKGEPTAMDLALTRAAVSSVEKAVGSVQVLLMRLPALVRASPLGSAGVVMQLALMKERLETTVGLIEVLHGPPPGQPPPPSPES